MAISFPFDMFAQAQERKQQNQRQMIQDMQGIGQGLGGGMSAIAKQLAEQKQKAAWQKTINEMMVNPNMAPGMKAMMPAIGQIGGQNPAVAGEMMAAFGKSAGQKANYRPVPGMLSKGGHPMVIDEMSGKISESGLEATPSKSPYSVDLSGLTWDSFSPSERLLAKGVFEGNIDLKNSGPRERSRMMMAAALYGQSIGEDFQSFKADVKRKSAEAFTSGKGAMNVVSLNTAISHIGSLADSVKKLGNVDQKWLNTPLNALRRETNDPNVIRLGIDLNAVRGELATAFKGTPGTDPEIAAWTEYFQQDLTPDQFASALPEVLRLLRGRVAGLEDMRDKGRGKHPGQGPLLSPHAKAIADRVEKMGSEGQAGAPPVGTVEGGFRFKGGDPAVASNWVKQ